MWQLELSACRRVNWEDSWKKRFIQSCYAQHILEQGELSEGQQERLHQIYSSYFKSKKEIRERKVIAGYSVFVNGKKINL